MVLQASGDCCCLFYHDYFTEALFSRALLWARHGNAGFTRVILATITEIQELFQGHTAGRHQALDLTPDTEPLPLPTLPHHCPTPPIRQALKQNVRGGRDLWGNVHTEKEEQMSVTSTACFVWLHSVDGICTMSLKQRITVTYPCNKWKNPAIPLWGTYPKELKVASWRDICTPMFIDVYCTIPLIWGIRSSQIYGHRK